MADVVFLGLTHWHVPMHVAAARACGLRIVGWDPDGATRVAWSSRESAPVAETAEEGMLRRPSLVVVTGTPAEMAARVAWAAASGLPVLVEKPVGRDAAELEKLISAPELRGAWVAVALPHRTGPVASAPHGAARHLSVRLVNGRPGRYRDWGAAWVLDPSTGGGGALRNLGVHGVDLARAVLGADLAVTGARTAHWHGEAVEDHAVVHLAAPSGATAVIEAGYLHPDDGGSDFEARLLADDAIWIDTGDTLRVSPARNGATAIPVTPQSRRYEDLMADVMARLRDGRPPAADLRDLHAATRLIDEAYRLAGKA
ncbi:Gfo/Idh/MocA family protein [Alsobacter sp. R-9]